jgi:hypothetical protein
MKMNKPIAVLAMSLIVCGTYSFAFLQDSSTFSPNNSGLNARDRSSGAVTADSNRIPKTIWSLPLASAERS